MTVRPATAAAAVALLLSSCGGAPRSAAPAPAPAPAAPPAPVGRSGENLPWGAWALAGASALGEDMGKACWMIRRAVQLRAEGRPPANDDDAQVNRLGAESLRNVGHRCGVQ